MRTLRSSVTLIDNFSATFQKMVHGADRSTRSIQAMQEQLNKRSDFENQMRRASTRIANENAQYQDQLKLLDQLKAKHALVSVKYGVDAKSTQALTRHMANAEEAVVYHLEKLKTLADELVEARDRMAIETAHLITTPVSTTPSGLEEQLEKVRELSLEAARMRAEMALPEVPMNVDFLPPSLIEKLQAAESRVESLGAKYIEQHRASVELTQAMAKEEAAVASLTAQYERYDARSIQAFMVKEDLTTRTKELEKMNAALLKVQAAEVKAQNAFEKAGAELDKVRQKAEQLSNPIENSEKAQKRFNRELQQGNRHTNGLLGSLKRVFAAYLGFRGAKKGFAATIGASAELDQQRLMMQAAFGDAAIGTLYFEKLQNASTRTGHSMEELTEITRNFMQLTKNTEKLQGLTNLAHRLSLRTQNIGSAEELMQEAMRGQYTRLQRTLHLTDSQLAPLKAAVQQGNMDRIMTAFEQALSTAGLTDDIVKAFENSPLQKFNNVVSKFKMRFAHTGESALARLTPLLDRIDRWVQSDKATAFFNAFAHGIAELTRGVVSLIDYVKANQEPIKAFLIAVGVLLMTHVISSTLAAGSAFLALNWPILLIVGTLALAIHLLLKLGITVEDIAGVMGAAIGILYATAHNGFAGIYNAIATVAEFLANVWFHPIHAAKELLVGFFDSVLANLQYVAEAWDWVFRTKTSQGIRGFRDELKASIEDKPEGYKVIERMEKISLEQAMQQGFEIGRSIPGSLERFSVVTEAINGLADMEAKWNALQLDTLGDISSNTSQMAEEDLKWLRDAAEQEVVNRFTSATLSPQIKIEFGDVKETADVDGIITKLKEILTEQINIAAEGVHA